MTIIKYTVRLDNKVIYNSLLDSESSLVFKKQSSAKEYIKRFISGIIGMQLVSKKLTNRNRNQVYSFGRRGVIEAVYSFEVVTI